MAKKILLIEDDDFFRGLVAKKLQFEGFEMYMAINGEEGVKKAKEIVPSLILLDLLLPTMDGFTVLSNIKHEPTTSAIPVIILSNLGEKEDIERGLKMGAIDYMVKSQFTPEMIVSKVKEVFEKK